ncbi:NAD-dependent epimerase/dehydratase family protein [Natrarchaeobius halalkaliphilus]|uniref:NAD-dependent epimerase/dehydratase family protein n=1 Tax=Natrarchaeobius halalkaliphilus TaxID=1679091 RepID=A0A3N6P6V7_9EURY|nr:NAD-dependent epimerase/dehydratase family protein [Natrarchaeobius halalkaliphilus]RQG91615.1 NAD-dependent epimerase/dehydratase family protein [Natrarchaeobius halalkaliphilus]
MGSPAIRDSTVLVTGGAGFIGSHLVEALDPHNDVRVLDNFSSGDRAHVPDSATVIEGDIGDPIALQRAADGVDIIFHHAALVSVAQSVDAPRRSNRTNLDASLLVLEQARREDARVVVASSAAVYGHPDELPVSETTSRDPTSPYGVQKLALDQYTRLYADLYGLETVALRYFNVYGPRQQGPYSGVISTFLEQARSDEPITIEGDGKQTRDFVHVSDVVQANIQAGTTAAIGAAYNVGTGERTSIRELAETIREATDSSSPIVHRDSRPGDIRHSGADVSRAKHELGFDARVGLESGVRALVDGTELTPRIV